MAAKKKTTTTPPTRLIIGVDTHRDCTVYECMMAGDLFYASDVQTLLEDMSDDNTDQDIYEVTFRKIGVSPAPTRTVVKE